MNIYIVDINYLNTALA